MQDSDEDRVGNILRGFYKAFGIGGEDPSPQVNVSSILSHSNSAPQGRAPQNDVELLAQMVGNIELREIFADCRSLLEDIASCSTGDDLCRELDRHRSRVAPFYDQLSNGICWYAQASQINPHDAPSLKSLPKAMQEGPNFFLAQAVEGVLVLRLYIALVYMRGDDIRNEVAAISTDDFPHMKRYRLLLNHKLVRSLRNALSHGHIRATIAGVWFKDREFEAIGTPGFLNNLCTWIFVYYYTAFMVILKEKPN